jgi:hypothetical protein
MHEFYQISKPNKSFKSFRRFGERILSRVFCLLPEAVDAYYELGDKRKKYPKIIR